jgi:hypothetical protein
MNDCVKFDFRITAYTPNTIPMDRLARYMSELANLMGSAPHVHFSKLLSGSTRVCVRVEPEDAPKVRERIALANRSDPPADVVKAVRSINSLLREDGATGFLNHGPAKLYTFPGVKEAVPARIGPIKEAGVLDGEIVRVGGKDKTIHVLLVGPDGQEYKLVTTSRDMAKSMANYLYCPVRVTGTGAWTRSEEGKWELEIFAVQDFEPIEDRSLIEAFAALQAVEGSGWKKMNDPLATWQQLRSH